MKKILITFVIILFAFFFRFNNLNWDENFHLHPDERFLTMVGTAMKLPTSINQYFDQKTSLMNPENIGFNFFVYGRFPIILTKYLAVIYNFDNYNDFTILGRQLSAFFDILIIFFIIKTVELLEKKNRFSPSLKYWAGFFYAIAVLPIQLSHFFAVDTFLNFFMFGSFYFALRVNHDRPLQNTILSSIFFGLALSCKITALFILPLNLLLILLTYVKRPSQIGKYLLSLLIYFGVAYFTLRLADPYYFQNKNLFDPTISTAFIENIRSLKGMTVKSMNNWYPPMVQWLSKNSVQHSLLNNIIFGLGIPQAILTILGILLILISNFKFLIFNKISKLEKQLLIILFWTLGFFVYQSIQVTPTLRYFIFLYPFFAIFAVLGIDYLINYKINFKAKHILYPKKYSYIFIFISVGILLLWPIMFSSIYSNKNSRVEASEWIYKNLPSNSVILSEFWDDALSLSFSDNYGKQFISNQLPVFDPDTSEKWQKINRMLDTADYYILSSNRGWGSITTVPEKYPKMADFYSKLLTNQLQYKKIIEFNSFPKFEILSFKFQINDSWSDESFTVYDNNQYINFNNFKKKKRHLMTKNKKKVFLI